MDWGGSDPHPSIGGAFAFVEELHDPQGGLRDHSRGDASGCGGHVHAYATTLAIRRIGHFCVDVMGSSGFRCRAVTV